MDRCGALLQATLSPKLAGTSVSCPTWGMHEKYDLKPFSSLSVWFIDCWHQSKTQEMMMYSNGIIIAEADAWYVPLFIVSCFLIVFISRDMDKLCIWRSLKKVGQGAKSLSKSWCNSCPYKWISWSIHCDRPHHDCDIHQRSSPSVCAHVTENLLLPILKAVTEQQCDLTSFACKAWLIFCCSSESRRCTWELTSC